MAFNRSFILIVLILPIIFAQTDYCNPKLCRNEKQHIGCNNYGYFSSFCNNPQIIQITPALRNQILDLHNNLRNQIAQGFGSFPTAARMATMQWNDELAKLAELNVKQCKMQHDQCRNTDSFPYSGQNIAITTWSKGVLSVSQIIQNHVRGWFNEYIYCPVSSIESYTPPDNGKVVGHFTLMIQDKATHVGCAILRHFKNGYNQQLMTCNYAFINVRWAQVYRQGPPASECTSGTDSRYTSLCSTRENYNLNEPK